ncbi:MAG: hypothetical protein QXV32_03020 [Conexivisphaerales archaeon]
MFPNFAVYAATPSVSLFRPSAPTFVGTAGNFLSGPYTVPSAFTSGTAQSSSTSTSSPQEYTPNNDLNVKNVNSMAVPDPPSVSCPGVNCQSVSSEAGGATTQKFALNAAQNRQTFGYTIEPPDQGLCANSQYVMEIVNVGNVQVFSASNLQPVSGVVSLDSLMGLTSLGWGSGGDVMCQYDPGNGGHWIITEFVSTTPEPFSPFSGCFAGVFDTCREGIAVSVSNNPMGSYYVYFLDPNKVNNDPGKGYLLNDFTKIAISGNALLLFYDEFNLNSSTIPRCPEFGCFGFNGAQEFAFNKNALEQGKPASSVNVAYENMGNAKNLYPIPENRPFQPESASCFAGRYAGAVCWYQVIPAQTSGGSSDTDQAYMVAALDFFGMGDNRLAVFSWNGLSGLSSENCSKCNKITFGGELLTTQLVYMDEGFSCPASQGGFCGLGSQRSGLTPLGDLCTVFGLNSTAVSSCPESGIASNGDGTTQAWNSGGVVWTSVSTLIVQNYKSGKSETHIGVAYWAVNPSEIEIVKQGYVTAAHADLEFPSIAVSQDGNALMAFTLSGSDYYPSSAYVWLGSGQSIHITAAGKAPQDGFTEYLGYPPTSNTRPRWGDYSQAVFVPATGKIFFATQYIQYPNCNDQAFLNGALSGTGLTCGGTRAIFANWGTSISYISS